ncbi:putative bifunctional diguanylate cyclase/phosphodiesterase [Salibaculum sp.]|uniref:putative bifunctional diguanylate cyclase/phosphodiesterase n=1 Tax=Salibaculum sp. TaxID=2855480 RepID=UPI002B49912E|nr:EAL domain-containing protein [Salibaculum sp.]HKL68459.1 EAL domain-containing protein [Salibaculum sp.]
MSFLITAVLALLGGLLLLGALLLRSRAETATLAETLRGTRRDLVRQLREAEHFRMACEHASDGIVIQTLDGVIIWPNPAYCRIMGRDPEEIIGRNPLSFALPEDQTPSREAIKAFRYDPDDPTYDNLQLQQNRRKNGDLFWTQISTSFRKSAAGDHHAILICRDVTRQIQQEERLREARNKLAHEATHDGLTGLSNRSAFLRFTARALETALETGAPVALLHADLDHFKSINDTHGHSAGDAALVHVAQALRSEVGTGAMVARIGGDEFVAVLPDIRTLDDLREIAARIGYGVAEPLDWNDRLISVSCSIGATLSPPGEIDPDTLLLQADFALYEAKQLGRARAEIYDDALHRRHSLRSQRASDLADAIDTATLDHVFQPVLDLQSQSVIGLETLARWTHPEAGTIGPDDFLPIAEELGLMGALDLGSMSKALEQKHLLERGGHGGLTVSFNASSSLLAHPEFVNRLVWGVEAGGLSRDQVAIEVLETTAFGKITENSSHAATIRDLHDAGFKVYLDDFGVGYAGLAHLAELAVSGVKIDRSLVQNVRQDNTAAKIVRKIIELCNDLGLNVVAEGVEDRHTANTLLDMGCTTVQGFWVSRPLRPEDLPAWLRARSTTPPLRMISG